MFERKGQPTQLVQQQLEPFLERLLASYERFFSQKLLITAPHSSSFEPLYHVPFIVVSHALSEDPIFNFANLKAQDLWELNWEDFTQLPSRKSAELDERAEREKLLSQVRSQGYSNDYHGIRVSSSGQRFTIQHAKVWNVEDQNQQVIGQAATFQHWQKI